MTKTCPNCKSTVDPADRFCGDCGAPISLETENCESGRPQMTAEAHDLVISGFERFIRETPEQAASHSLALFARAIGRDPDLPEAHFGKALCLAYQARLAEALACVDAALALGLGQGGRPAIKVAVDHPDDSDKSLSLEVDRDWALVTRADILLGLERPAESLEQLDQMLELGASGVYATDIDAMRAIALVTLGRLDEAETALTDAVDWDPSSARVAEARGRLRFAQGRTPEAIEAFTEAIAGDPDDPDYPVLRARALIEAGRKDEARADLAIALRIYDRMPAIDSDAEKSEIGVIRTLLASL